MSEFPEPPTRQQLEQVIQEIDPGSELLAVWELKGGISARMTALEVRLAAGQRRKMIVRQPGARAIAHNPHAAAGEFKILQIVQVAGVKAQTPYLLDLSGTILPAPYLVIEYIEGAPEVAPANVITFVEQIATQLATLHGINGSQPEFTFLPQQAQRLAELLKRQPAELDHSLDEGRIRAHLEAVWPLPQVNPPALLHGDFWPGNLLWKDGKLVAVIDWEDAEVGNPLADFAISRLDVLWIFGPDALPDFTQRYRSLVTFDFSQLAYWDLCAALRPASRIAEWAEGWPELGRSDITEATMRSAHKWFVNQAFENLSATRSRS
jgi:aminoglycoside phosphotransferase (APT) family kinase protein